MSQREKPTPNDFLFLGTHGHVVAVKLDPSKGLLNDFIALNNSVLNRFTADERKKIGVHTCPAGHLNVEVACIEFEQAGQQLSVINIGAVRRIQITTGTRVNT